MPKKGSAVIGLQWGDESKGKVVDMLTEEHDIGARLQGGANAGHMANGVDVHAIPSTIIRNKRSYIAACCAVHLPGLVEESANIERKKRGVNVRRNLQISPQASIVQPHQILCDMLESGEIGTTNKGIGPHYADKARRKVGDRRVDLRVGELRDYPEDVFRMMRRNLKEELERARENTDVPKKDLQKIIKQFGVRKSIDAYRAATESMRECIGEDPYWLSKQYYKNNMRILLEGAQAEGLDLVRGTTPYVTSSRTGLYGALESACLPREAIKDIYGIGKLVTSRVGFGPFVSEYGGRRSELYCMKDGGKAHTKEWEQAHYGEITEQMLKSGDYFQIGKILRLLTGEYGVTSKRPRRVGAFDTVQFKQAAAINEVNHVVLSKLDCLNLFALTQDGQIPIVVGYELDGKEIDYIPTDERTLRRVRPLYEYLPAFDEDITSARSPKDLPVLAKRFIKRLEELIGVRIDIAGVGPAPDQNVYFKQAA